MRARTTGLIGIAAVLLVAALGLAGKKAPARFFESSDRCLACHNGLVGPAGEDVSIGIDWRSSMMANSARDPYWQAGVRREVLDHPAAREAIEGECSICHMPMARFTAHAGGAEGEVFSHLPVTQAAGEMDRLAADGASCTVCHQILPDNLGEASSFVGGFEIDTAAAWGERLVFGPFDVDDGRRRVMASSSGFEPERGAHMRESALCGTCHTLYTAALGKDGRVVGELPEQMPYLEWLHSRYPDSRSCQSCHMRELDGEVAITSVLGQPRTAVHQHVFRGGNFLVQRLLGRYRAELGTAAFAQEQTHAAERTVAHLESESAQVVIAGASVADGLLTATIQVENLAGHKLPTAYPSRRAWLAITVRDGSGAIVFESGVLRPDGSIAGNDNDEDPARYEPHHLTIDSPDKVQIYEAVLGGPGGEVTTGLLTATRYLKDNRLLPEGFDQATAHEDVSVKGAATGDGDFVAGADRVHLSVPVGAGPLEITVALAYQPIGYRWAMNLAAYDAAEPARFVSYYEAAAKDSAVVLASDSATAAPASPSGE